MQYVCIMENAQVKYSNGWVLIIPKNSDATMLFMEWLSTFRAGRNWLHKVNQTLDGCFSIHLNMAEEKYHEAAEYINANL